ncbi:MAG: hypothetical protein ED557_12010 [Balneola sp.]|nr:MAG: hypothetical protein ED557_12010 [Balneola sp.]
MRIDMKNLTLCTLIVLVTSSLASAQWTTNGTKIYYDGGKVGIGMTDPNVDFQVNGTVGVGTLSSSSSVAAGLSISYVDGGSGTTTFRHSRWGGNIYFIRNSSSGDRNQVFFGGNQNHRMEIYNDTNEVKVQLHSNGASFFTGGDVGIGTESPTSRFHVFSTSSALAEFVSDGSHAVVKQEAYSDAAWQSGFLIQRRARGTVDIPEAVQSGDNLGVNDYWGYDGTNFIRTAQLRVFADGTTDTEIIPTSFSIRLQNDNGVLGERFRIAKDGNVGIGTTTPGNKLEVNGTARAKEIIVEATGWPDYVFHPDYELRSLSEIEAYIKAKGHLPEVPSAKQVEEEGQHLGEMQQLLLKKIEEMTLHLIEQNKLVQRQQEKNESLEQLLVELKRENEALKQRMEKLEHTNNED